MNRINFITAAGVIIFAVIWNLAIFRLSPKLNLIKLNYNKRPIMASYGIVEFVYIAVAVCVLYIFGLCKSQFVYLYLFTMGSMWILGILDDIFGSREVGGFKGHFKKLIFEHKITTGAIKAIGGGIVSLYAGWMITGGESLVKWAIAFIVIALATNTLNLLDLRPGRAAAVFFLGLAVTYIAALGNIAAPWIVASIVIVTIIFAITDSRGKAMMGDSGSNSVGAAMGLGIVINTGIAAQIISITIFAAIHIYSEKHSISALIEKNRVLNWIDRRLGVR